MAAVKAIKMRHCDECANHRAVIGNELACALDHKPRWFAPKNDNPHDINYGWKRKCEDFRELPVKQGVETVTFSLRVTEAQREKLARLGGAEWVRKKIDRAKEPDAEVSR